MTFFYFWALGIIFATRIFRILNIVDYSWDKRKKLLEIDSKILSKITG